MNRRLVLLISSGAFLAVVILVLSQASRWPEVKLVSWAEGFNQPVGLVAAPQTPGRFYVLEQAGMVQSVQQGRIDQEPFLDISDQVLSGGEKGLLGMAFCPHGKPYMYVNYTDLHTNTVLKRFGLKAGRPDLSTGAAVLQFKQPGEIHNGGQLVFGPDQRLYMGSGDGGGAYENDANPAQHPDSPLGKILRMECPCTWDAASGPIAYSLAALGLRNPWAFSFDRQTGDLFIGDVGERRFEEINCVPSGTAEAMNFGWDILEGPELHPGRRGAWRADYVRPAWYYGRDKGGSVTGGYVYRGERWPSLQGLYIFGDFVSGSVWGLRDTARGWKGRQVGQVPGCISAFGEDASGELFLAEYIRGAVYRLEMKEPSLLRRMGSLLTAWMREPFRQKVSPVLALTWSGNRRTLLADLEPGDFFGVTAEVWLTRVGTDGHSESFDWQSRSWNKGLKPALVFPLRQSRQIPIAVGKTGHSGPIEYRLSVDLVVDGQPLDPLSEAFLTSD